jgi:hypothetical protein
MQGYAQNRIVSVSDPLQRIGVVVTVGVSEGDLGALGLGVEYRPIASVPAFSAAIHEYWAASQLYCKSNG